VSDRRVFITSVAGGLLGVSSPTDTVFRRFFDAVRSGPAERGYVKVPRRDRA
jgi:hypothetical protein